MGQTKINWIFSGALFQIFHTSAFRCKNGLRRHLHTTISNSAVSFFAFLRTLKQDKQPGWFITVHFINWIHNLCSRLFSFEHTLWWVPMKVNYSMGISMFSSTINNNANNCFSFSAMGSSFLIAPFILWSCAGSVNSLAHFLFLIHLRKIYSILL